MSEAQTTSVPAAAAPAAATDSKEAANSSAAPSTSSTEASQKNAMSKAVNEVLKGTTGEESDDSDETEDDASEELTKKEEKEAKRLWKLKVQGKDLDVDEAELVKRAQMGYSADQKWQEASQLKKQIEGFLSVLQNDPSEALAQMGFNVDDLAEKHIQRRIEEMQKSPEQLEREKLQKEVEKLRSEAKSREDKQRESEMAQMQQKFAVDIENDILETLSDPSSGIPKSPFFIKRIADTMIYAMKNGYNDITAKEALNLIRDEVKGELRDMYATSPDELFEDMIGKDRLVKYRKGKIKKVNKTPGGATDVKATGQSESKSDDKKEQKKMLAKDFFRNLGSR